MYVCIHACAPIADLYLCWGVFKQSFNQTCIKSISVPHIISGVRCSSVDRSFMVDPLSYFSFQPVLQDWRMCHPVCGVMHIKEPFLLIGIKHYLPSLITVNSNVLTVLLNMFKMILEPALVIYF